MDPTVQDFTMHLIPDKEDTKMKSNYVSPEIEVVELSENDVLLFSKIGIENGSFDIIDFGEMFK